MDKPAGDTSPTTKHGCGCCHTEADATPAGQDTTSSGAPEEAHAPEPATDQDDNLLVEESRSSGGCCGGHGGEDAPAADTGSCCGHDEKDGHDGEETDSLADQVRERTEDLQRVTAEYANYRRRTERDRALVTATAKASVVADFLPVVDDLELARKHGDLTGGLKAIHDKLQAAFTKLGVTPFGAEGDAFDPEIHEALQDLSSGDDKVVGTVVRTGFMIGDKLLRTAMVIIADPAQPEA